MKTPGGAATVGDEVDDLVAERRGGAVEAPIAVWRDQRAQPARPAAPILRACAPGEPGRADLVARRVPIRPRPFKALVPSRPLPDIGRRLMGRPPLCGHRASLAIASVSAAPRSPARFAAVAMLARAVPGIGEGGASPVTSGGHWRIAGCRTITPHRRHESTCHTLACASWSIPMSTEPGRECDTRARLGQNVSRPRLCRGRLDPAAVNGNHSRRPVGAPSPRAAGDRALACMCRSEGPWRQQFCLAP
jgi:hypothetical protein